MNVDVGVVTWNTRELTVRSLRRLLDTNQDCSIRLLVRDNGSTDGTVQAIRDRVPEAEIDAGVENLGFAAGMNTLLARSGTPWFLCLNSDAWPESAAVGTLVRAGESSPRIAVVAPRLERPDGTLEHSTHPFPSIHIAAAAALGGARVLPGWLAERWCLEGAWRHDRSRSVDWAVGAALLLRREAIEQLGMFDDRFFMYTEDLEWCWRARQMGWEIRFEPAAVVHHVGNASGCQVFGDRRMRAYLLNTYRFYRRHHGAVATAAYRALNLAGSLRNYGIARLRRNHQLASFWRDHLRVHVESVPVVDVRPT